MPSSFLEVAFPIEGIDLSRAYTLQRKNTCQDGQNVRAFDPLTDRARGGSRGGLAKYCSAQLENGGGGVQDIIAASLVNLSAPIGQPGRSVTLVAVSGGTLLTFTSSTKTQKTTGYGTGQVVFSAVNSGTVYYANGASTYVLYNANTDTAATWTASAGSLPTGNSEGCTLIEAWNGRIALSGLRSDPHNIFFSCKCDPTDWNYAPATTTETQAVALNLSNAQVVGDVVRAMIPVTDDILVILGDHSLWQLTGDPMAGGRLDCITNTIGGAWGRPWCMDPYGTVYFFSNQCGVYSYRPGQLPIRMSQQVDSNFQSVNTGTNLIRMVWSDKRQGFHLFITPITNTTQATHYFWELRSNAWFKDQFAAVTGGVYYQNPKCCCLVDGDNPNDRAVMLGSWNGYVMTPTDTATTDDSTAIASCVVIGPILTKDMDEIMLNDFNAILGAASGTVTYSVYYGRSAEEALASTPLTGTLTAGRNANSYVRWAGYAFYIKLSATTPWAMEQIRCRITKLGKVRARG